ncbi:phage major capsid protein, P2 family [Chromobacterium alkanivorans]|uniref:phage major capsid protein, P2 family n=1 Tax=Chromobacterium alkanivorans TaxID=1071719 RepID=UPI00196869A6|nr:phage major capsid protein, P2 family [Chromobacterium alkanivorans]MBN3005569.1 phage major capsid protein, P2 family [Chromobacterium alkanivorans]
MRNTTRLQYNAYLAAIAKLNGVDVDAVISKFSVTPSVQQTLETKVQESSAFLQSINMMGVSEQEGEALGLGISGPIAGTQDTDAAERSTRDVLSLTGSTYRCEQTNYDTHLKYATLDAWAKFPDFQTRLRDAIIQRIALDRMMIGFNGTSRAATSNRVANPLLQDVNKGWLQKIRDNAPQRWLKEVVAASGKVKVGATGDYKTLDAVVFDAVNDLIEPWFREDTQLVAITGRQLMADKYFPLVNTIQAPTEQKAAQDLITSQKRIGNLQAVQVPYFPANAILITRLDNLSVYYQEGSQRRSVLDNPKRDRIETFQSSNDAFVLEDYGCAALIENIELV